MTVFRWDGMRGGQRELRRVRRTLTGPCGPLGEHSAKRVLYVQKNASDAHCVCTIVMLASVRYSSTAVDTICMLRHVGEELPRSGGGVREKVLPKNH